MATQQNIADAIAARLIGDSGAGGVAALVSNRIWEAQGAQNTSLAFVRWAIISDPVVTYFSGQDIDLEFQIDVFGKRQSGADAARTIAEACFALFHLQDITITNHVASKTRCIDKGRPEPDEDSYGITQRYQLTATVS